ncbi:MAG TPA: RICIN domain-containing protein [Polyangiaceae bacterium]|nr:RICIN domain-containing protein [Polyangiaceae bacterium]
MYLTLVEQTQQPTLMYAYFPVVNQNLVVDLLGDQPVRYQRIDVTGANGTPAQNWERYADNSIRFNWGYQWCMTAASATNGAAVYLAECTEFPNQHWDLVSPHQIVLEGTELCLDVPAISLTPGTHLQVWTCNGGLNQQFSAPPLVSYF